MKIEIRIGKQILGHGHPTYVIAEAGSNHNQDFEMAKAMIKAAAEAGADAIKFQAFRAKEHYSKYTPNFTYLKEKGHLQSTYDLVRSLEINREWHPQLMKYAESRGIMFFATTCDVEAVGQLGNLGVAAFKMSSFDLPDVYLLQYMAKLGKPLILSTGMADYADIQTAVQTCRHAGNEQIVLLQCTSLYPAPVTLTNLAAIKIMRNAFGCLVGYSDHTLGDHIAIAAVARGACVIEKHFTLDRSLPGPDHSFAIEPDELAEMVRKIRDVENAIGDGMKDGPREEELEVYEKGRRSIHAMCAISPGEIITRDKICIKRPGYGIPPKFMELVTGMRATKSIPEDHWIGWDDLK